MAPGQEIQIDDLPIELRESSGSESIALQGWESALRSWASRKLADGDEALLEKALPAFERVMIEAALARTGGRRQDAARLLGWGRNTLTRKIRELELDTSE
jgi:two-component system nitrogen regulation response regulator GlnG